MTVQLSMLGGAAAQFFDNNGSILSGGKLYTYIAGTTTPQTTYTSNTGATAHTNPIILDSAGRVPGGEIWLTDGSAYKFILKTSADVIIASYDSVDGNASGVYNAIFARLADPDGATLVAYTPAGIDAVATDVQTKLRETVSVKDFGAVGDGVTDDTAAIQAAIEASQVVYFPAGQYKITDSIKWQNQWLIGAVDNGELSTAANQTMILADGTFPAFKYYNPFGFNAQGGGIKNFNIYFADGSEPATATTRPNAIGFYVASTGGYPAFHTIESITVRGGMWGVFDQSGSWMGQYKHINVQQSFAGFFKAGGTTHSFENCYMNGGKCGFNIVNCNGVDIKSSAVDLTETNVAGYRPVYVENSQVAFTGCDFEGIKVNADLTQIALITGNNALVHFDSCIFLGSDITAATEIYGIHVTNGARVSVSNVDFTPTNYSGTGGVFAYLTASNFAAITADNVFMPALTGSGLPATVYATYPKTSNESVTYSNIITPYDIYARSLKVEASIQYSVSHDFPSVSSGGYISQAFTVAGSKTGDIALADIQVVSPIGLIITAHVTAANTVTVSIFNLSGSSVDLAPAQVNIKVLSQQGV